MPAVQAVIFDCFGVLTTDGWLAFREAHFAPGSEAWQQASDANLRCDRGMLSYEAFIAEVAALAGERPEAARQVIERHATNERLFAYIRDELKPRYQIGMLSNAGANWLDELFSPWQVALFDEIALSYQIRVAKPDAQAYAAIAAQLGVAPEACVFIDDQPRYVAAAQAAGMHGMTFTDTTQCTHDLAVVLREQENS